MELLKKEQKYIITLEIEFDENDFFDKLAELKEIAYTDGSEIRQQVRKIVPSYKGTF